MSVASTRPVPRPLQLVANATTTEGTPAPRSAPLVADSHPGPQPRRQSSISYKTGVVSPRRNRGAASGNIKHETQDAESSHSSTTRDAGSAAHSPATLVEPVTLAEKHADLLRFIAQKESRCLELRTQLAQHEADLLLLKRKWERIVSKGGPRIAQNERSDVLEGIREGVQSGLGKVLAALEPAPNAVSQTQTSLKPAIKPHSVSSTAEPISSTPSNAPTVPSNRRTSVSSRARSSLSGSGSASSAGSLFDDAGGLDNQSSASSVLNSPVLKMDSEVASAGPSGPLRTIRRNSYTPTAPIQAEPAQPLEAGSSTKQTRRRPASVLVASPRVTGSPPPALSPSSGIPLARQVSAWVPDLNRRWEELKSNETLSRQSKRASVLLNDVLAVLAPPAPPGSSQTIPSPTMVDSTFFEPAMAAMAVSIGSGSDSASRSGRTSQSLLDDDEDEGAGAVGAVLKPEVKSTNGPPPTKPEDDDGWNW